MGYVSKWGGMDVGSGMMFSAETIDGLLHQLGGLRFRAECSLVPPHPYAHAYLNQQRPKVSSSSTANNSTEECIESNNIIVNSPNLKTKCPVGTAVSMSAVGGEIPTHYDHIIHTVPPFYNYPPLMTNEIKELLGIEMQGEEDGEDDDNEENLHQWSKELLRSCYRQSFNVAFGIHNEEKGTRYESLLSNPLAELIGFGKQQQSLQSHQRVHCPLLGAGCRDFPKEVAKEVAALESASWLSSDSTDEEKDNSDSRKEWVVAFGLLESEDAEALSNCIGEKLARLRSSDAKK
jgi:O-acetyl-ADP-ribose deacetylase (regulator of RNase III)